VAQAEHVLPVNQVPEHLLLDYMRKNLLVKQALDFIT
jgi:hypothetical protein